MFLFFASVLFIFGPSCGGKSILSKALIQQLGPSWAYLDRDQLIEDGLCVEEEADQVLEDSILFFQSKNQSVLVDAQIPWRAPKNEEEKYVLVYAPLSELIARDAQRTIRLQRSPKRARYARIYVEETFSEVFKVPIDLHFHYHVIFDSSVQPVDSEVKEVIKLLSFYP